MKIIKKSLALILAFLAILFSLHAQEVKPFENGDKIAFVGNSITEAGFYESNIWLYYMTRFPERRIRIFNKGVGGNVSGQINDRLKQDVLVENPDVVLITFGMNDSKYFEYLKGIDAKAVDAIVKESKDGFDGIVAKLKQVPNVRKIIMSSSPYDDTMEKQKSDENVFMGKVATMEKITDFQEAVAKENNWEFLDIMHPMMRINQEQQEKNPKYTLTGSDRIHPGEEGHFIMAYLFLKGQGFAGKPIADVEIDSKAGKVLKNVNSNISSLAVNKAGLSFDYLANALPFPVDTVEHKWLDPDKQSNALKVIPFIKEMNQEILKINNLKNGTYSLLIDDKLIGAFTASELQQGINLATYPNTPQYLQASAIMYLNRQRKETEDKLRQYDWLQFNYLKGIGLLYKDDEATLDNLHQQAKKDWAVASKIANYEYSRFPEVRAMWKNDIDVLINKIYQINKPVSHHIKLQLVN